MADRTTLSFEADEEVTAQIAEALDEGRHGSLGDYLRDLIRKDREDAFDLRNIDVLREAFAVPDADCRPFDANAFRAEMLRRHG